MGRSLLEHSTGKPQDTEQKGKQRWVWSGGGNEQWQEKLLHLVVEVLNSERPWEKPVGLPEAHCALRGFAPGCFHTWPRFSSFRFSGGSVTSPRLVSLLAVVSAFSKRRPADFIFPDVSHDLSHSSFYP